jgi:hypothetical protein
MGRDIGSESVKKYFVLVVLAGVGAAPVFSQSMPPAPASVTKNPSSVTNMPVMTVENAAVDRRVKEKLRAYVAYKAESAVSDAVLAAAGLSPEHDFREQARVINGTRFTPFHAGKLVPDSAAERAVNVTVDPALTSVYTASLRARLGRTPTNAEIAAEVQAFDARIAQQNAQLAGARREIAERYRQDGRFPRDVEHRWMDVAPADPERSVRHDAEWRRIIAALMTSSAEGAQQLLPGGPALRPGLSVPQR